MEKTENPTYEIVLNERNFSDDPTALVMYRLNLPEAPGVYKYKDKTGKIIYVGKANNLRRRVNSYFTKQVYTDYKTLALVKNIASIEYVVTDDEMEALLLENSLIKEYQPKYNVQLRDGKSYPYIAIKNERFPRVMYTRNKEKDGSLYFGPYPSSGTMYAILNFMRDVFKFRTCNYALSEKQINSGKIRPCLEYHIGKCNAPCVGKQTEETYNDDVRQVKQILKGDFKPLLTYLKKQMEKSADELNYEQAHFYKTRIEHVHKYRKKSTVVSENVPDVEVVTVATQDKLSVVNHFKILNGAIIRAHAFDVWRKNEENELEVLAAVVSYLISQGDFLKTIFCNLDISNEDALPEGYSIKVPTRGDEKKLIELSLKNCQTLIDEKMNLSRITKRDGATNRLLEQLQKDLRLTTLPAHIECFDNSNIQGYAPVSSCVVFRDGKPAKREYRVFNVQTVEGPNDFATMYEVVYRRYKRRVSENLPLPDLVVIDGGKGQLSSALQALRDLEIDGKIAIISIAKRLEEIYFKEDPIPLYIDKKSSSLKLIQHLRNEAHDTAINFHRKKRSQKTLVTELTDIHGVGTTTAHKLLAKFRSIKKIKESDLASLSVVVGDAKARVVWEFYHSSNDTLAFEK